MHLLKSSADSSSITMWDLSSGQAIQFVRVNEGNFELDPEGVAFLKGREKGIALCSIAGKFRSGKSFLLNRVMGLRPKKGFAVSPSVNPCTRGLWIWTKPLIIERQNLEIFFVDTEGLDSPGKEAANDAKLFALVVMISSFFIFNSNGCIDEPSIESLSLVTHIISNIAIAEEEEGEVEPCQAIYQLSQYAPNFLWVLRNVVLELQDLKGRTATAAMYLESSLSDVLQWGGQTRNYEQSLEIRKGILNFFKNRDCLALIRPHKDEKVLQKLQDVAESAIQPEFIEGIIQIRHKILAGCHQKIIDGVPLTGPRLVSFLKQFTDAFNARLKPFVSSTWRALLEAECDTVVSEAERAYSEKVGAFLSNYPEGVDPRLLYEKRSELRMQADEKFSALSNVEARDEQLFGVYQSRLQQTLDELDAKVDKINEDLCLQKCTEMLEKSLYEFLTELDFEGQSEYSIVEQFAQKHLLPYLNASPRHFNTRALAAKMFEISRKLIESYSKFRESEERKQKNEAERAAAAAAEQIRAEEKTLAAYAEVANALENEAGLLRRKYSELSQAIEGDHEVARLRAELESLKMENEQIEAEMKTVGAKIGDARSKIEAKGKKRWAFCG